MTDTKLYVQFGSGNEAIPGWLNFDASPTLRLQRIPVLGSLIAPKLNCKFDDAIKFGDIVRGLPLAENSVDGLFCAHVLEHLSYQDFESALENSFRYLKPGGLYRIIVPDLVFFITNYVNANASEDQGVRESACFDFCKKSGLGVHRSRRTLRSRLSDAFGGSRHLWMWDQAGLTKKLLEHGFVEIVEFEKGKSLDEMFNRPEREHQFAHGLCLQCRKP